MQKTCCFFFSLAYSVDRASMLAIRKRGLECPLCAWWLSVLALHGPNCSEWFLIWAFDPPPQSTKKIILKVKGNYDDNQRRILKLQRNYLLPDRHTENEKLHITTFFKFLFCHDCSDFSNLHKLLVGCEGSPSKWSSLQDTIPENGRFLSYMLL